jgi:hypothetical protein
VKIVEAGNLTTQQPGQPLATFDSRLQLAEAALEVEQQRLTLIWNCLAPLAPDETIFVHVFDVSGQLVAQADGAPLRGFSMVNANPASNSRYTRCNTAK